MRISSLAVLILSSLVGLVLCEDAADPALQVLEQILPTCSAKCLTTVAPQYDCSPLDSTCICAKPALSAAYSACITLACTPKEVLISLKTAAETCQMPVRNQAATARAVCWGLFAMSTVAVASRFLARSPMLDGPGYSWDDWTMLFVVGINVPMKVGFEIMIENGLGQDIWMLAPNWKGITTAFFYFWTGEIYYNILINGTKVSILLLYLRIFPEVVATLFRTTCRIIIVLCSLLAVGTVMSVVFECSPIAGAYQRWDGETPTKCINTKDQVLAGAGINIALDLLIFCLPIPKIIRLQASIQKRAGVCLTFLVGLFVTVISILRTVQLAEHLNSANPTWNMVAVTIWSMAEADVGIVCACMPSFARLIRKAVQRSRRVLSGTQKSQELQSGGRIVQSLEPIVTPEQGLSKTVETSVYSRKIVSSDEIELMGQEGVQHPQHQHMYTREW